MKLKRSTTEFDRVGYALSLLETSGYEDPWKYEISKSIYDGSADEVEMIIIDLEMNQVDKWEGYRLKDINKRLDKC